MSTTKFATAVLYTDDVALARSSTCAPQASNRVSTTATSGSRCLAPISLSPSPHTMDIRGKRMELISWSIAARVAQCTLAVAMLSSCAPRRIATYDLERRRCANVPGSVRLHFAATRMPELERQGIGALLVEVRSMNGPPIEGVLVMFGTNPPHGAQLGKIL